MRYREKLMSGGSSYSLWVLIVTILRELVVTTVVVLAALTQSS